jgi:hypothetical protein
MKMGWEMCLMFRCLLLHQKGTHISFLTPKNVYYKLPELFGEVTFCNCLLIKMLAIWRKLWINLWKVLLMLKET